MLPHVQPRSGGLAVPITIIGVVSAATRFIGNDPATPATGLHGRAPHERKNYSRL